MKDTTEYLLQLPDGGKKRHFRRQIAKSLARAGSSRDWAEFGVYKGESAKIWIPNLPPRARLYLFDAWEGLPTAWGHEPAGILKCKQPTFKDDRIITVKGWFSDTLPGWVAARLGQPLGFVHIDCDVRTSVSDVLSNIRPLLDQDTLILFDELYHDERQREHEFRAFQEFVTEYKLRYEYVARSDTCAQVTVRVFP